MRPPRERLKGESHPSDRTGEMLKVVPIFLLIVGLRFYAFDVAWIK